MAIRERRQTQRGFTLVEMLTVVVIVGILATLAVYGVRKYVLSAKTSEAVSMISLIKAAEEAYRDETFRYLNVSQNDYSSLYPIAKEDLGTQKTAWGGSSGNNAAAWRVLGVQPDAPVQFGYAVVAVGAGEQLTNPPTNKQFGFPADNDPSYCVLAQADLDADGNYQYVVGHSFNSEIYIENEGE